MYIIIIIIIDGCSRLTRAEVDGQPLLAAEEVGGDAGEGPQDVHVGRDVPEVEVAEGRQQHGHRRVACPATGSTDPQVTLQGEGTLKSRSGCVYVCV